jgi:hypothetical protein
MTAKVTWRSILGAVELEHALLELRGDRRHERRLERSSGDDDLIGRMASVVKLNDLAAFGPPDGADAAAQHDRQPKCRAYSVRADRRVLARGTHVTEHLIGRGKISIRVSSR